MRILDAFCGAGGAGMGYSLSGFEVVGVDIKPQPHFPFEFHQGDALEFIKDHGHEFDAIHASPVCKKFSKLNNIRNNNHPDYITPLRPLLKEIGKPYIIENVVCAPLENPVMLCGTMFGLRIFRHRLFESSINLTAPPHIRHKDLGLFVGQTSRKPTKDNQVYSVYGHFSDLEGAKKAMGIDWMNQRELCQAIPPAYTKYIGDQLMEYLKKR
jgi:DNA (cytosine-5)-methyltransferase 1